MSANLAFRMDDHIKNLLEEIAAERNTNKTEIMKEALSDYFEKQGKIESANSNSGIKDEQRTETINNINNSTNNPTDVIEQVIASGNLDKPTNNKENNKDLRKDLGKLALFAGAIWILSNRINQQE